MKERLLNKHFRGEKDRDCQDNVFGKKKSFLLWNEFGGLSLSLSFLGGRTLNLIGIVAKKLHYFIVLPRPNTADDIEGEREKEG